MDTNEEGTYEVTVTDYLGCSKSILFDVVFPVFGDPSFNFTSFYYETYNVNSINDPITFSNNSTGDYRSVFWDFGDESTSSEETPTHTYTTIGTYDITLYALYDFDCDYFKTQTLYIGDSYEIIIPNAFTPNNDGLNEVFRPQYYGLTEISLKIFNKWGNKIYEEITSENELNGWDGTINGKEIINDNYYYQINAISYTGEIINRNGAFTLIK